MPNPPEKKHDEEPARETDTELTEDELEPVSGGIAIGTERNLNRTRQKELLTLN